MLYKKSVLKNFVIFIGKHLCWKVFIANVHAYISAILLKRDSNTGVFLTFFCLWVFFHNHSRITELQGKGEGTSLTPHYHVHPLYRHLDISRVITAESSPLHIGSSGTQIGNLWFST